MLLLAVEAPRLSGACTFMQWCGAEAADPLSGAGAGGVPELKTARAHGVLLRVDPVGDGDELVGTTGVLAIQVTMLERRDALLRRRKLYDLLDR